MIFSVKSRLKSLLSGKPIGLPPLPYIRDNLRNLTREAAKKGSKSAANSWLEWYYGWRQLISDINGIAKTASKLRNPSSIVFKKKTDSWSDSNSTILPGVVYPNGENYDLQFFTDYRVDCSGSYSAVMDYGRSFYLSPVTVWELIPYSFVVDWFISIGQSIQAGLATLASSQRSSCVGIRVHASQHGNVVNTRFSAPLSEFTCSGSFRSEGTLLWRIPTGVSVSPMLNFHLSRERIASAIALAVQRLR
jgi:hypothetical protein